jgi:hypothetical protein
MYSLIVLVTSSKQKHKYVASLSLQHHLPVNLSIGSFILTPLWWGKGTPTTPQNTTAAAAMEWMIGEEWSDARKQERTNFKEGGTWKAASI